MGPPHSYTLLAMSVPLTRVYRGTQLESVHRGSIAVVDSRGKLLAFAGDPATRTCLRSAAKPFQGIPLLEYGGIEEYELTQEEIALTCASHGGEPLHVATAAALLRKGEFDEEDLLCGAHFPYDEKVRGGPPRVRRAAFAAAQQLQRQTRGDAPRDAGDGRPELALHRSPIIRVQALMRSTLADFADVESDDDPDGHRRLRRSRVFSEPPPRRARVRAAHGRRDRALRGERHGRRRSDDHVPALRRRQLEHDHAAHGRVRRRAAGEGRGGRLLRDGARSFARAEN